MTRVPPQRLPTARPAAPTARPAQAKRPKGAEKLEKPQKLKGGGQAEESSENARGAESGAGAGPEAGKERDPREAASQQQHEGWAPDSHAEAAEKKDAKEAAHAEKERKEEGKDAVRPGAPKPGEAAKQPKSAAGPNAPKRQSDGFERKDPGKGGTLTHAAHTPEAHAVLGTQAVQARSPVNAVAQTRPALAPPPSNRPPDAFQLLHQAQEKGVYFKEDSASGGEREDPELAAAVEEAIRLLFGVRGILRVGPGKNMENEPVVVVVATQGFGEAALKVVPQTVHRFPTLLAIPFDLLPLKKER